MILPNPEKKENFWTTLPGLLTGLAALLTALTGLWIATAPHGSSARNDTPAITTPTDTRTKSSTPATAGSIPSATPAASGSTTPAPQSGVTVTSRKGEVTHLSASSFRHNYTDEAIQLSSGQTIAFERIQTIDFLTVNDDAHLVAIKILLVGGKTFEGSLPTNYAFKGESELGPFTIFVQDVKQIAFGR